MTTILIIILIIAFIVFIAYRGNKDKTVVTDMEINIPEIEKNVEMEYVSQQELKKLAPFY